MMIKGYMVYLTNVGDNMVDTLKHGGIGVISEYQVGFQNEFSIELK